MSKKRKNKDSGSEEQGQADEQNDDAAQRKLFIRAWEVRDKLYRNIFGDYTHVSPENYGPPSAIVKSIETIHPFNQPTNDTGDPGLEDQRLAVLAYGPDPMRPYWTYITAGLSSPWLQQTPEEVSGFGCEIMIKSPTEAKWPAQILRSMAYYIFNHAGTLSPGVRIALNAPIAIDTDSLLRNVVIWYADEAPDCWYQLPSGGFGIFTAIGITDDELAFAESIEEYGTWCIQQVLRQTGSAQITDPQRESAMKHENIGNFINSVTTFANQFRGSSSNLDLG